MKAVWNNQVIAEADKKDLILIEGNWYFPPGAIHKQYFTPTEKHTTCIWKGLASYYQIEVDGEVNEDGAWYYPDPAKSAIKIVGKDFTDYVAFWHGVEVVD